MNTRLRAYRGVLPVLGERVYIDPAATVIGRVTLGDDVSVWPSTVIRGDVNTISVGARTSVQDGSVLHVASEQLAGPGGLALEVGPDVTIGHNVILHACTVGHSCLIGMGAIVLDGTVIGDEVIVGAGSVVPPRKQLPARTLWVGNPARQVRALGASEVELLHSMAAHYVRIKNEYLAAAG
jgi:carbonic anhydrase/acetyltransferase-like protein (isoleucine patch superfamily)